MAVSAADRFRAAQRSDRAADAERREAQLDIAGGGAHAGWPSVAPRQSQQSRPSGRGIVYVDGQRGIPWCQSLSDIRWRRRGTSHFQGRRQFEIGQLQTLDEEDYAGQQT